LPDSLVHPIKKLKSNRVFTKGARVHTIHTNRPDASFPRPFYVYLTVMTPVVVVVVVVVVDVVAIGTDAIELVVFGLLLGVHATRTCAIEFVVPWARAPETSQRVDATTRCVTHVRVQPTLVDVCKPRENQRTVTLNDLRTR
jgi:hypothetical protein